MCRGRGKEREGRRRVRRGGWEGREGSGEVVIGVKILGVERKGCRRRKQKERETEGKVE